jgi:ATP phosphoribosyltransferase
MEGSMRDRLRLAIPNKGRLVQPTVDLLHEAGLTFEAGERALVAHVQNFDLDILFVRTNDVVEFVADGVAELGITGLDLVAESGAAVTQLRKLGYGRCRLTVAVPNDCPYQRPEELAGQRVATSHMNLTKRFFAERSIDVNVVPVSGAAEVAPRLGLAEAIVDLVSTGSTMVVNGLRPLQEVFRSEAVLIANTEAAESHPGTFDAIQMMLTATLAARDKKYLMMNAPVARAAELESLLPGLESPSVIPLAHEGMIAIHSVVDADAVWSLLPKLKAGGASGILVLPIEKLVP